METATKRVRSTATATAARISGAAVKRPSIDMRVIILRVTANRVVTTQLWRIVVTDVTTAAATRTANVMVAELPASTIVLEIMPYTVEPEEHPAMARTIERLASMDAIAVAIVNVQAAAARIRQENITVRVTNNMFVRQNVSPPMEATTTRQLLELLALRPVQHAVALNVTTHRVVCGIRTV